MLNSKFYLNDQVDFENKEEVIINDSYETIGNKILAPAILNKELIITSRSNLVKIRTLDPA